MPERFQNVCLFTGVFGQSDVVEGRDIPRGVESRHVERVQHAGLQLLQGDGRGGGPRYRHWGCANSCFSESLIERFIECSMR